MTAELYEQCANAINFICEGHVDCQACELSPCGFDTKQCVSKKEAAHRCCETCAEESLCLKYAILNALRESMEAESGH